MVFRGPFCLGVTRKTGEAEEHQRDERETAKKSDGAKTRSWAGGPHFSALRSRKRPVGSLPPIVAKNSAECFGPVATGREKKRELEERKEKASAKGF
jgi:hypothetical protein